ncbi:MAG: YkgJ family cysteine cluster protein [Myxococcales bacterium]|nr:YkgJ family cysteine cluster protein [Myxococcales bacterium]
MKHLTVLDAEIAARCEATCDAKPDWPCRAGCDDCCRSLAAVPVVSPPEWERLRDAVRALTPSERAEVARAFDERRARGEARPIVCPLLGERGLCRVYGARPLACRSYGFYADHEGVLGCGRIHTRADDAEVLWGNHEALLRSAASLGDARSLLAWAEEDLDLFTRQ